MALVTPVSWFGMLEATLNGSVTLPANGAEELTLTASSGCP